MATLAGNTIAETYPLLLKIASGGIDGDLRIVEDGDGTESALSIATDSVLVRGSGIRLYFHDADGGEHIAGDGTDLTISSGNDIVLAMGSGGSVYSVGADGNTGNTVFGESTFNTSTNNASDNNVLIGKGVAGTGTVAGASGNVGVGFETLKDVTDGGYNVAIGYQAGQNITSADECIAIGTNALNLATLSQNSIAIGRNAMSGITTNVVSDVVAIGFGAFQGASGTTSGADGTVAIGTSALKALTTGENNIAIGHVAADAMTVSNRNVILGAEAFTTAATATGQDDNIGIGYRALNNANVQDFNRNIAIGSYALSATGTNQHTGTIAIGFQALAGNTSGQLNTAIGYNALVSNVAGDKNVAIGYQAGEDYNPTADYGNAVFIGHQAALNVTLSRKSTVIGNAAVGLGVMTGHENTAIGNEAGYDMTSCTHNLVVGNESGANLTSGSSNVAVGSQTLISDLLGTGSTAVGYAALNKQINATDDDSYLTHNTAVGGYAGYYNITGVNNTYIGYEAGFGSSSYSQNHNTAIGADSLKGITGGGFNTVVGSAAGSSIDSGNGNAMLGFEAGDDLTSGSNCIFIGRDSNPGTGSHNKQIGIGYLVETSAAEQIRMGDSTNYLTYDFSTGGAGVAITSDERTKKDIVDTDLGLEFIKELRPIKYRMKATKDWPRNFVSKKITDAELDKEPKDTVWDGFLAQEVKAVADKLGLNYSGWTEDAGMGGRQELDYARFVVPLVKAVQELSAKVKALEDA